ncbi:MAG: T9SS type A sorting domain-containing protein [Chitinophagales bacterium]|nr:T9SS type A sorting domain-containing protein [Chitinophagaceae bacterium]MCB9066129.1 T9SS type A sorting domain-containing protein [Chitinophagales bacterium]
MRHVISLAVALTITLSVNAQNHGSLLLDKVNTAHNTGERFKATSLFQDAGVGSDDFAKQFRTYKPNISNISNLYREKPNTISIPLTGADGKPYTLELIQSHPTSRDARINYVDETGLHTTTEETGLHYQGIVKGTQKSMAAISMFANGDVMILFSCDDGNFNMGKVEDNSGNYMLYKTQDRMEELMFNCATPDGNLNNDKRAANKTTGAIGCNKLRAHWEVDYTFYQAKVTIAATQNYLMGIFNFMQSIYYNDGMAVEMSSMKIWTVDDPFTTTTAWDGSWQFGRYWQSQKHSYYGEQPTLIANYSGWQGYANLGAICFPNGYACCNMLGTQSATYPVFDVDVYLVSHETGHTVGADHTQSCGWNTGPGGTCGSVDNCVAQYGGGCGTCYYLHDANATNFKGTIMSYCGGKINFSEGFGSTVGSFLRNEYSKQTCFADVISTELITQPICNSDGAITLNYPSNNFGVAPYTYTWSNSATTKDITGLSTAGEYSVVITDSNNCSTTDTAILTDYAKPGDGNTLPGTMPYCCIDTMYDVTLTATLPTNISSCQTVAWLRTSSPLTSYNDAKTAYNNATTGDILQSDNDTSINNSTAAQLTISSPASCNTTTTYYYTPFVTRKATQQTTYTTNATNPETIKNGTFSLGTSMTIPAEPTLPAVCLRNGPTVTDTITVTISNYTGRANNLTIRIIAADKHELYQEITLAGDGVYTIPITGTDDHFQEMTVKAFDFNCPTGGSCANSSLTMAATRKVTYEPMAALGFDSSCVVGTSVLLSFGPDNCNVGIQESTMPINNVSLYPNPAGNSTTLSFTTNHNGKCDMALQDVAGKTIYEEHISYTVGTHQKVINTSALPSGVYIIRLQTDEGYNKNLKLEVR